MKGLRYMDILGRLQNILNDRIDIGDNVNYFIDMKFNINKEDHTCSDINQYRLDNIISDIYQYKNLELYLAMTMISCITLPVEVIIHLINNIIDISKLDNYLSYLYIPSYIGIFDDKYNNVTYMTDFLSIKSDHSSNVARLYKLFLEYTLDDSDDRAYIFTYLSLLYCI